MDWIRLRHACNAQRMFECLLDRLKRDVSAWEQLDPAPIQATVKISEDGPSSATITRTMKSGSRDADGSFILSVSGNRLSLNRYTQAKGTPKQEWFTPTLNASEDCVLLIGNRELELWQASRHILEPLLF